PESPPPTVYVVRRGDSRGEIAKKFGVQEAELLKINRIRNRDFIYEGQKLQLVAQASGDEASRAASAPARETVRVASAPAPEPAGAVPAEVAQREVAEEAAAIAAATSPAGDVEPVSAAQAEELSPALGPAIETPQSADPNDYSAAEDGTILVLADETLGHYAEWLDLRASQLRAINK